MKVLISGATGFVGRAVAARLAGDGHVVIALVRDRHAARKLLPASATLIERGELAAAVAGADVIVNLAGEPIVGRRWTEGRRDALRASRLELTRALCEALAAAPRRERTLISASASGYYGDRGAELLDEQARSGTDFLARLCVDWEQTAQAARTTGARVTILRLGVVLGPGGGALQQMVPVFRAGLGGPLGTGAQYLPWIHLDDVVELVSLAAADERYDGALNVVAPQSATNREFTRALARTLHRPALLPAPAFALRAVFGEAASAMLASQRLVPARLTALGFPWRYPTLDSALAQAVGEAPQPSSAPAALA